LVPKITELLNLFRFHVAPVEGNARLRERIEGTLGRYFQDHDVAGDERFFGTEARFPAAIPYEKTLRCRFTAEGRIAGLPDELIV
jgi:hypothetical protein